MRLSRRPLHTAIILTAVLTTGVSCVRIYDRDVSSEEPYARLVGRTFRIDGHMSAFGIKRYYADPGPYVITLYPPHSIEGPEVAFEKEIKPGQTFQVRSVRRHFVLFDDGTQYVVEMDNEELPPGIEIRIAVSFGNEVRPGELNPKVFTPVQ